MGERSGIRRGEGIQPQSGARAKRQGSALAPGGAVAEVISASALAAGNGIERGKERALRMSGCHGM